MAISKEKEKKEKKKLSTTIIRWSIITILIFIFSFVIGYLTSLTGFTFNLDTFTWFSSTIAQTFGALVGIIIAISLYYLTCFSQSCMQETSNKDNEAREEIYARTAEDRRELGIDIFPILISMSFLITISLFSLMFANSSMNWEGVSLNAVFILLFIYSAYALSTLFSFVFSCFFN